MKIILCYLLLGSYAALFYLWKTNNIEQSGQSGKQ